MLNTSTKILLSNQPHHVLETYFPPFIRVTDINCDMINREHALRLTFLAKPWYALSPEKISLNHSADLYPPCSVCKILNLDRY